MTGVSLMTVLRYASIIILFSAFLVGGAPKAKAEESTTISQRIKVDERAVASRLPIEMFFSLKEQDVFSIPALGNQDPYLAMKKGRDKYLSAHYAEALEYFQSAFIMYNQNQHIAGEAEAATGLGLVYTELDNHKKALDWLNVAKDKILDQNLRQNTSREWKLFYSHKLSFLYLNLSNIHSLRNEQRERNDYLYKALGDMNQYSLFVSNNSPDRKVYFDRKENKATEEIWKNGKLHFRLTYDFSTGTKTTVTLSEECSKEQIAEEKEKAEREAKEKEKEKEQEQEEKEKEKEKEEKEAGLSAGKKKETKKLFLCLDSDNPNVQCDESGKPIKSGPLSCQQESKKTEGFAFGFTGYNYTLLKLYSFSIQAIIMNRMGDLNLRSPNSAIALSYYQRGLQLYTDIADMKGQADSYINIGNFFYHERQYKEAIARYRESLLISYGQGYKKTSAESLANIGKTYAAKEDSYRAIAYMKQAVNLYEDVREEIKSLPRIEQVIFTATVSQTYHQLADLLIQQDRLSEAQQVIELLKFRELKNFNFGHQDLSKLSRSQALLMTISEKEEIRSNFPEIAQDITATSEVNKTQLGTNFTNQKAKQLISYEPHSALIYHLITDDKLWILLVTPDGKLQKFSSDVGRNNISDEVNAIRGKILCRGDVPEFSASGEKCTEKEGFSKRSTQQLKESSQILYNYILPRELKATLRAKSIKNLIFALDGDIRNLPIAALYDGQQYMVEQFSLSQVISASLTDNSGTLPNNLALGIGITQAAKVEIPPTTDDNYSALSWAKKELFSLFSNNQGTKSLRGPRLFDQDATLPNIKQSLAGHSILHIVSHAIFRPNSLESSYILLGGNSKSNAQQTDDGQRYWSIAKMDSESDQKLLRNIHLVTLSACQTGLGGRNQNGMEIPGISYAFMNQGAKAVNASLWNVNDTATANLMAKYYELLATKPNLTKAQAIQKAQIIHLNSPVDYSENDNRHPYYWAGFILVGNNR
jgi:CHAT domain-containing protein